MTANNDHPQGREGLPIGTCSDRSAWILPPWPQSPNGRRCAARQSACFCATLLFFYLSFKGFPQFTPFYAHFDSRSTFSIVPCFIAID
jgi:hypothetical protein